MALFIHHHFLKVQKIKFALFEQILIKPSPGIRIEIYHKLHTVFAPPYRITKSAPFGTGEKTAAQIDGKFSIYSNYNQYN
jgi:hypothetical protein